MTPPGPDAGTLTMVLPRARKLLFSHEPDWHFSAMLGLELLFVFGALPALASGEADRSLVTMLQLILVTTAIALIAKSRWLKAGLGWSFGLTVLARLVPGLLPPIVTLSLVFACTLLLNFAVARAVLGPGQVNHHRIAGAVFVYINTALLFAVGYTALLLEVPDALSGLPPNPAHNGFEMMHFSLTTLTAIGDGAIAPHAPVARSMADLETMIGQLFPALLLSRLVGLHITRG
jgi:hypothetical protein